MNFRMRKLKMICASALLLTATLASVRADDASDFAKANREYAAGHFQSAIDGYEALVRAGRSNATLFYNLGNAWFRLGDSGRAILNYDRALALDPQHPEVAANLQLVRDRTRALELTPGWAERYLDFTNPTALTWIAAAAFWIGLFCFAAFFLARRGHRRALALCILAFLICAASIYTIYALETGNHGRDLAIITGKNIQARLATADSASSILVLPAGSEVQVLSTRGDWTYAALPNNLRGWIPTDGVETVRL